MQELSAGRLPLRPTSGTAGPEIPSGPEIPIGPGIAGTIGPETPGNVGDGPAGTAAAVVSIGSAPGAWDAGLGNECGTQAREFF